jgi:hypothetical protein
MTNDRVKMFISHKVATHKDAAECIKEILESRTERLDVYICEEIKAGDRWREWIDENIAGSSILLVLLPHTDKNVDLTWVADEIGKFQAYCKDGRLVVLKYPSDPIPGFLQDLQVIELSKNELITQFLQPLYQDPKFINLDAPLNPRINDIQLLRDADEIEQALLGMVNIHKEFFGESLVVDTTNLDVTMPAGMENAVVRAPNGCKQILNWSRTFFTWKDLRARATEEKGKGTFWVSEMEQVIAEVAMQNIPEVMTSTFRGRGDEAGKIFRPQLESVEYVGEKPVKYQFFFHEVLVPELVRGSGPIGEVFNLLHIATRMRWEVLNPFLIKLLGDTPPSQLEMSEEERKQIIDHVMRSIRIIDKEADRHNMLDPSIANAFESSDSKKIDSLLSERRRIRDVIADASNRNDFVQFMKVLIEELELNGEVTEALAKRFLELVQDDRREVKEQMEKIQSVDSSVHTKIA